MPLTMLEAPYRGPIRPLTSYVKDLHDADPRTVIMVFNPEYVVTHWWQQLLDNQSALRFKARLLFTPGVVVVSVPTTSESPRTAGWSGRGRQESVNVLAPGVRISSRCAPRRLSASSV
jgi:hypothetical protein